ncbi:hypothetical protein AAFF_G00324610 [Aldrovandia affinis]|uniref:Lymphoid-restricted membrane protein-like n=1 Tax=Aldrovandia affinis TaxID=143900 RepID=A0AAD7W071_9TELE|nr:hypothetical protein AAFF_G00324610 [Aldrovandia affinis]
MQCSVFLTGKARSLSMNIREFWDIRTLSQLSCYCHETHGAFCYQGYRDESEALRLEMTPNTMQSRLWSVLPSVPGVAQVCHGWPELSQEDLLEASWDELSILERLGLNSLQMTEDEVERAFTRLALAFRCDQFTLRSRLQAESLKALCVCLDSTRTKILQRLELCLSILGGSVERITTAAEVLGAVHQEARVSRAVELMVAHVESLKRQHTQDRAELEEARRLAQRAGRSRQLSDPRGMCCCHLVAGRMHCSARRRISIAVISKQLKSQGSECRSSDHQKGSATLSQSQESQNLEGRQHVSTKEDLSGNGPVQETADPLLAQVEHPTQSLAEKPGPLPTKDALWQRRGRFRGLKEPHAEEKPEGAPESRRELSGCDRSDDDSCTFRPAQRPLVSWLSHCHLILFWLYVMTVSFVILLGVFLWSMRGPLFWI